jgi:hypothetical protein
MTVDPVQRDDLPKVEPKLTAAIGGAGAGGLAIGGVISWLVLRYMKIEVTPEEGWLVIVAITTGASTVTSAISGWFKKSKTSAVSEQYNAAYAKQVHQAALDRQIKATT